MRQRSRGWPESRNLCDVVSLRAELLSLSGDVDLEKTSRKRQWQSGRPYSEWEKEPSNEKGAVQQLSGVEWTGC